MSLKIFSRPACSKCNMLKMKLKIGKIPFEEVNIDVLSDEEYDKYSLEWEMFGVYGLPIRKYGEEYLYTDEELFQKIK